MLHVTNTTDQDMQIGRNERLGHIEELEGHAMYAGSIKHALLALAAASATGTLTAPISPSQLSGRPAALPAADTLIPAMGAEFAINDNNIATAFGAYRYQPPP